MPGASLHGCLTEQRAGPLTPFRAPPRLSVQAAASPSRVGAGQAQVGAFPQAALSLLSAPPPSRPAPEAGPDGSRRRHSQVYGP